MRVQKRTEFLPTVKQHPCLFFRLGTTSLSYPDTGASTRTGTHGWHATAFAGQGAPPRGRMQASTYYVQSFILSPNTGIIFSAVGTLSGNVVDLALGDLGAMDLKMRGEITNALNEPTHDHMNFFESHNSRASGTHTYNLSGYLHSGRTSGIASITFETLVIADVATPVPEPATCAMLLAGLALVGYRARRKCAVSA